MATYGLNPWSYVRRALIEAEILDKMFMASSTHCITRTVVVVEAIHVTLVSLHSCVLGAACVFLPRRALKLIENDVTCGTCLNFRFITRLLPDDVSHLLGLVVSCGIQNLDKCLLKIVCRWCLIDKYLLERFHREEIDKSLVSIYDKASLCAPVQYIKSKLILVPLVPIPRVVVD